MTIEEEVTARLRRLPDAAKREVLALVEALEGRGSCAPRRSLKGACVELNVALDDADLREARRELWGSFPREDGL